MFCLSTAKSARAATNETAAAAHVGEAFVGLTVNVASFRAVTRMKSVRPCSWPGWRFPAHFFVLQRKKIRGGRTCAFSTRSVYNKRKTKEEQQRKKAHSK